MLNQLLVLIGGGIGALLRYYVATAMKSCLPGYIGAGTLVVNVVGSLAIGYWMGGPHDSKSVSETSRLFFVVGVLGGLTTFSSLAYETMWLTDHRDSGLTAGMGHLSANVILGLGAVWLGVWLGRSVSAT